MRTALRLFAPLVTMLFAVWGASAQTPVQIEYDEYVVSDGVAELLVVNGDRLVITQSDLYLIGKNSDSPNSTERCSWHGLRRDGKLLNWISECTMFYLDGGTHQTQSVSVGPDEWRFHTVFGTGKYANIRCEGIGRTLGRFSPPWPDSQALPTAPIRAANHLSGTCMEMSQ